MRRTEAREAVRMAVFLNLLRRWESAELNQEEAAELLGVSERTFRRWARRYEEDGEAGLVDRRLGKASGRRVPTDRAEEVERLYRERYQGFTVKHFHEHLVRDHGFGWGYTWLKLHLQWAGLAPKAPRKGAHRRKRERRPLPGMMLHQDGSRHAWLEGQPALDLIVTLDDATGAIYSAFLVEEEGTASTFRALKEVFSEHCLPMSLYTDRGAHYFHTPKAGGEIDRGRPTQVGRALEQLGVEHIGAYSPQARGRSERTFGTLQDRLVKELALAGITDIEAANAFIREVYLPAHNARFAVEPAGEGLAFTPIPGVDLDEILCVEEERQVGNDNCVSYQTLKLQIPESPMRPHFVKARIKVRVYPHGAHALWRPAKGVREAPCATLSKSLPTPHRSGVCRRNCRPSSAAGSHRAADNAMGSRCAAGREWRSSPPACPSCAAAGRRWQQGSATPLAATILHPSIVGKPLALPIQNVAPGNLIKQKGNSVSIPVIGHHAPSSINST
jgi:transposase